MNKTHKGMITILMVIMMAGCKKESTSATPPPAADNTVFILQSGDWKMSVFTISPALNGVTDVLMNMPPCAKDNLFQFKANGIFVLDDGATKCNPADAQSEAGTWSYNSGIKQLKFTSAKVDFEVNIQNISSVSIVGTRQVIVNGVTYTYAATFEKQ